MGGEGLIVRTVFTVVRIVLADGGAVGRGETFGLSPDGRADVGRRCPAAVNVDLSDPGPVMAEMPVRRAFEVAVALAGVQLHVIARRTEVHFKRFRITHDIVLLMYKSSNVEHCSMFNLS